MDLLDKCTKFTRAKSLMAKGIYPYFNPLDDTEGSTVTIDGRELVMVGSNNYLGLTTHPKVREAAAKALSRFGTSCTGSRFLNGNLALHQELDRKLAEFFGYEAAICFSTGYQTNLGVISALVGRGDIIIIDEESHASIIDGCHLATGEMRRFRHNDIEDLERQLKAAQGDRGILVAVDGVYSMGGDLAKLPEIVPLCKRYGARIMVDDAHGVGVLGGGRGTCAHFGVTDQVDLITAAFSKAFASLGGVVAGSEPVIHYIQHRARSLIFSASMPPSNVASVLGALDVMQTEPEWIERLHKNAEYALKGLSQLGFNTGPTQTPIVPIILGNDLSTIRLWKGLFEAGAYTNPVLSPAVPPGGQRLRTSYMGTHKREHIDRVLDAFERVGKSLGIIGAEEEAPMKVRASAHVG